MGVFEDLLSQLAAEHQRLSDENRVMAARLKALDGETFASDTLDVCRGGPVYRSSEDCVVFAQTPEVVGAPPSQVSGYRCGGTGMRQALALRVEPVVSPMQLEVPDCDMDKGPNDGIRALLQPPGRRISRHMGDLPPTESTQFGPEISVDVVGGADVTESRSEQSSASFDRQNSKGLMRSKSKLGQRMSLHTALSGVGLKMGQEQTFIINPEQSRFLELWDRVILLSLAYVAIVSPVQLSMLETKFDMLLVINCIVDFVLFVDMILQFFIMYPKQSCYGYSLEHRWREICRRYLRTWFVVDFVSVVPIDLVSFIVKTQSMTYMKFVKILRLLRLMKLVRLVRASRLIRRYEARMSITYKTLALGRFFVMLAVITHWMASLWALTLMLVEEGEAPRWIDVFDEMEKDVSDKTKDTPWKLYVASVYFTSYTLTSVGYGDIGPHNILERVVCTIMIIISGTSWAVVLGQVCGIVANMDGDEQAFRMAMDDLNFMMRDQRFPQNFRRRLRNFYLSNKTAQRRQRHRSILRSMSSGLQGEVVMQFNRPWIMKVSLIKHMMNDTGHVRAGRFFHNCIVEIAMALEFEAHAQSESFGQPQVLYILRRGLVSRPPRLHLQGNVWGADFILSDTSLAEPVEAYALTYTEITFLCRNVFIQLVNKYGDLCPEVKARVRWWISWCAFQRAMMKEARRRQRRQGRTSITNGGWDSGESGTGVLAHGEHRASFQRWIRNGSATDVSQTAEV